MNKRMLGVLALAVAMAGSAWGLSDAQRQALANASANVKGAAADLSAAQSSAGTTERPATGSRLRLTQMRLEQANARLAAAAGHLEGLPAGDADVQPVQTAYDEAKATADAIAAILAPKDAPAPAEAPKPAEAERPAPAEAPASAARLHYQQEDALKNARFHLNDAAGYVKNAGGVVAKLDDAAQAGGVVARDVELALRDVATAQQKLGNAARQLASLPADHPTVAPVVKQHADALAQLGAIQSRLTAAGASRNRAADLSNYPAYDEDLDKVRSFTGGYRDFQLMKQQPEELAALIAQDGAVLAEVQRIATVYAPLAEQKTDAGTAMERAVLYFFEKRNEFAGELVPYGQELPTLIDADLAEAMSIAQQGVNESKPLFFGPDSGVEQRIQWAEQKLIVLSALLPEQGAAAAAKVAQVREQVKVMGESLREQIIASNPVPADNFRHSERDAVVALATQTWAEVQPGAEVLKACIPMSEWTRKTEWVASSDRFSKVDASTVQVQLLVRGENGLAVIRPVNVRKDHMQNDRLRAWALDALDSELPPHRFVKLEKVR